MGKKAWLWAVLILAFFYSGFCAASVDLERGGKNPALAFYREAARQGFSSWGELVSYAIDHGVNMHVPVPGLGNKTLRFFTRRTGDDAEPLDLFGVYAKPGNGPFQPEGLYIQRICYEPGIGKSVSYVFLASLEGTLLKAYKSSAGSLVQLPIEQPETIRLFTELKHLWANIQIPEINTGKTIESGIGDIISFNTVPEIRAVKPDRIFLLEESPLPNLKFE